jgi:hypothetical protein
MGQHLVIISRSAALCDTLALEHLHRCGFTLYKLNFRFGNDKTSTTGPFPNSKVWTWIKILPKARHFGRVNCPNSLLAIVRTSILRTERAHLHSFPPYVVNEEKCSILLEGFPHPAGWARDVLEHAVYLLTTPTLALQSERRPSRPPGTRDRRSRRTPQYPRRFWRCGTEGTLRNSLLHIMQECNNATRYIFRSPNAATIAPR